MSVVDEDLKATEKRCTRCELVKPVTQFARDSSKPNGIRSQCKECRAILDKARRETTPRTPRVRPSRAKQSIVAVEPRIDTAEKKKLASRSEAHKGAILKLIDRHRTEFERLVYSEQVRLGVIALHEQPRERWVSLN